MTFLYPQHSNCSDSEPCGVSGAHYQGSIVTHTHINQFWFKKWEFLLVFNWHAVCYHSLKVLRVFFEQKALKWCPKLGQKNHGWHICCKVSMANVHTCLQGNHDPFPYDCSNNNAMWSFAARHSWEQNLSHNQCCRAYEFTSTPDDLLSSCDLVLSVCGSADCCSFCNLILNFSLYATSSLPLSSTCFSNVVSNMDIWKKDKTHRLANM